MNNYKPNIQYYINLTFFSQCSHNLTISQIKSFCEKFVRQIFT